VTTEKGGEMALGYVCMVPSACRAFTHIARTKASGRRNRPTPIQRPPNAAKVSAQIGSRAAAEKVNRSIKLKGRPVEKSLIKN
jgi:hypothetical protein